MIKLRELYLSHFKEDLQEVTSLGAHASERKIYRLKGSARTVIGVENSDASENRAFVEFARHFRKHGLPVPEIYCTDSTGNLYLEEDLGDETLFLVLSRLRTESDPFPKSVEELFKKVLNVLPSFQVTAGRDLDYSLCHGPKSYDRESMLWDMKYFRESYLEQCGIPFDKAKLEKDFETFSNFLHGAEHTFFLYRDLQSRNIMIRNGEPWFIDFQSGRRGPLQYDVASLLFQSSAAIPDECRTRLLEYYLTCAEKLVPIDRASFLKLYDGYVLIRMMQVLGTYGKQGIKLGKKYFLESIPHAVRNISEIVKKQTLPDNLPELRKVFEALFKREKIGN